MKRFDINIIHRIFSETASSQEIEALKEYLDESRDHEAYVNKMKWIWDRSESLGNEKLENYNPDVEAALTRFHSLAQEKSRKKSKMTVKKWSWFSVAASFILVLGSWQVYLNYNTTYDFKYVTGTGESKLFILPDSSKVWLAENSELEYIDNGKNRMNKLNGEGYFDVTTDWNKPFIIEGQNIGVKVLGTKFNMKAKEDSSSKSIFVAEGKVKYYNLKNETQYLTLTDGEFGHFEKNSNVLDKNISKSKNLASWATGKLIYENTDLPTVLAEIEKHYNILINVENEELLNCTLTTEFDNEKIDSVLETIALIYQAEIITEGNTYYLKDGACH